METQDNNAFENGDNIMTTTTAFDCGGRCPLRVHVKDGKITQVETDDHETKEEQSRLRLTCRALKEYTYYSNPCRLQYK